MKMTLNIDDDVFQAAQELAERHNSTAEKMISELARKSLPPRTDVIRNGVPLLPRRDGEPPLTMEMVNRMRDEDEESW